MFKGVIIDMKYRLLCLFIAILLIGIGITPLVNAKNLVNPSSISINYDDKLINTVFDIRSNSQTYYGLTSNIVYFKVTNLTSKNQKMDLSTYFSEKNVEVTSFSEWVSETRKVNVFDTENTQNFFFKSDLNSMSCVENGMVDYDSSYCSYFIKNSVLSGTKDEVFEYWSNLLKKVVLSSSKDLKNNYSNKGGFKNISFKKYETKYFMLEFSHEIGSNGEFLICANDDCLDPWWNSSYSYKIPITITSDDDYNFYNLELDFNSSTLGSNNSVFWANTQIDGDDVRFVDSTESIELGFNLVDWNDNIDAEFVVQSELSSGSNTIYVYFGNGSAVSDSNSEIELDLFDDFEDGDYNTGVYWTNVDGSLEEITVQSIIVFEGSYGLRIYQPNPVDYPKLGTSLIGDETDFNFYFRQTNFGSVPAFRLYEDVNGSNMTNLYLYGDLAYYNVCGGSGVSFGDISIDTWYNGFISVDEGLEEVSFYVYSGGSLIASDTGIDFSCGDFSLIDKVSVGNTGSKSLPVYLDLVQYGGFEGLPYVFGVGEGLNSSPDVNFVSVDNIDFGSGMYFGLTDNNLSIDFNVSDFDANSYLILDLNYNSVEGVGGTSIIQDLNLLTSGVCDDTNFEDSTHCSWDWNISGVGDNNYWITANLSDGTDSNNFISSSSLIIDNTLPVCSSDVNSGWQSTDANIVVTCSDVVSGVKNIYYRLDENHRRGISLGDWRIFDNNILINEDGNFNLVFLGQDYADNNSGLYDSNFILINHASAKIQNTIPINDSIGVTSSFIYFNVFEAIYGDINVFINSVQSLDFNQSTDCIINGRDLNCSFISNELINTSWNDLNIFVTDINGAVDNYLSSFEYVYSESGPSGGGSVGVVADDEESIVAELLEGEVEEKALSIGSVLREEVEFLGYRCSNMWLLSLLGLFILLGANISMPSQSLKKFWLMFFVFVSVGWFLVLFG